MDVYKVVECIRASLIALKEAEEDLKKIIAEVEDEFNALGVGMDVEDDEPFMEDDDKALSLAFVNGKFRVIADCRRTGELIYLSPKELSLNDALALIRSDRLTKFLIKVGKELNRKTDEIKKALEKAEEILNALR